MKFNNSGVARVKFNGEYVHRVVLNGTEVYCTNTAYLVSGGIVGEAGDAGAKFLSGLGYYYTGQPVTVKVSDQVVQGGARWVLSGATSAQVNLVRNGNAFTFVMPEANVTIMVYYTGTQINSLEG